jgi:hypothetical protein
MATVDWLYEIDHFHLEGQRCVLCNKRWIPFVTVGLISWADESGLLSLLKLCEAVIPSLDDGADTELKLEWLALVYG